MQAFTRDLVTRHGPGSDRPPRLCTDDAEALLDISALLHSPSPEWVEFIGETVSTWLVEHRAPSGVVDAAKAHWLLERIDEDGQVSSPTGLALLRRCCVKARAVPGELMHYLRRQEEMLREGLRGDGAGFRPGLGHA